MSWGEKSNRIVPTNWKGIKARVLRAHDGICHLCKHPDAEQVDHILNVARGGTHDDSNLAPIHGRPCPTCGGRCHAEKTGQEAAAGRTTPRRVPPKHPGLL